MEETRRKPTNSSYSWVTPQNTIDIWIMLYQTKWHTLIYHFCMYNSGRDRTELKRYETFHKNVNPKMHRIRWIFLLSNEYYIFHFYGNENILKIFRIYFYFIWHICYTYTCISIHKIMCLYRYRINRIGSQSAGIFSRLLL